MFFEISGKNIEVFYFNAEQCETHNLIKGTNLEPGYYYENFQGPFTTQKEALDHASS